MIDAGEVQLVYCCTELMLPDALTKELAKELYCTRQRCDA
jgi:hypothetical protein